MRALTPSWRWIPAAALAVLLLSLLAQLAAHLYPSGDLGPVSDPWADAEPLRVLIVEVAAPPEPELVPEDPDDPPPPEPEPDLFRSLWGEWVAGQAVIVVDDASVLRQPADPLAPITLDWRALAISEPDTTVLGLLARTMALQKGIWEDHKIWAIMGAYGLKAARYNAMKASVFNEDWLSEEHFE